METKSAIPPRSLQHRIPATTQALEHQAAVLRTRQSAVLNTMPSHSV